MKLIRKLIGWFFMISGGLWTISAVLCAGLALTGQLEGGSGLLDRVAYIAGFLLMAVPGVLLVLLGWKVKGKTPKPAPVVRQERVKPAPKAEPNAEPVPAPRPAPVKKERTPLPTWVTGPGLCHDCFPFAAYYEEGRGLDSFRGQASCHVYNGDVPLEEAIRALVKKERRFRDDIHVRLPSAGVLEYLDDHTYAQKWERVDAVPVTDLGFDEALLSLCREHGICIVTYAGEYGLYDHVNGCRLHIHVETWYGSVDDAATYGGWDTEEIK